MIFVNVYLFVFFKHKSSLTLIEDIIRSSNFDIIYYDQNHIMSCCLNKIILVDEDLILYNR